jgi:tryptophan halogenase
MDIVIVGGGTAGWMTAATLAKVLGSIHRIRLVESDEIGIVGVGEATIPPIRLFNKVIGLDENDVLKHTQGTFKLGIEFVNWGRPGHRYIHAFGPIGRDLGLLPFHQYWLKHRQAGGTSSLWDYSLNARAALQDRFTRPSGPQTSPLAGITHAFHFDAGLYAKYLRRFCEAAGVKRTEGKVARAERGERTDFISAVVMEDGERIAGDLFIDCSGFRGLLIEQELKAGYEDWSQWLPCDRALAVPSAHGGGFTPYTRSTAHGAGWQWRIPLQHRVGNGHVYCSRHISDDEAAAVLLASLDGEPLAEPRPLRFTAGKRKSFWKGNVVAMGLASGFMEPLESTSIHLIQSAASRLLSFFPGEDFREADIAEFNRQTHAEYDRIRDFIVLHYKLTQRDDTAFWRECRDMQVPEELALRMQLFASNGRIRRTHEELFTDLAWLQVMLGQGIEPQGYHPAADLLSEAEVEDFLGAIRGLIERDVAAMPMHADYVAGHCAARELEGVRA